MNFYLFTLPYPPSNNRYYRHMRGRTMLSKEGRAYRQAAMLLAATPFLGIVRCTIDVFPPTRWGQDLDNIPKAICDAIQAAGILKNDRQIGELHVHRREKDSLAPRVVVTLEEMG